MINIAKPTRGLTRSQQLDYAAFEADEIYLKSVIKIKESQIARRQDMINECADKLTDLRTVMDAYLESNGIEL